MKKIRFLPLAMTLLAVNMAFAADEIHWTITGKDSVTFDWRGTAAEKTIGYGLTSGVYTQVTAATPNPVPVLSSGPFWEAKLTGLTENTRYYYSIGNGPERSFRTPAAPGSSDFIVYAQGNIGSSSTYFNTGAVQDIIANDLPSFVVGLGDLTLGSKNGKATIDQHFNDVMVWSKEAAYMPVWGDLDAISSSKESFKNYKGRFAVPNPQTTPGSPLAGGEDWYWFDYGNVRFITMPDSWTGAWADWKTKADALMAQAQTDPNIKFIVTMVHQPAYSSGHYAGSSTLKGILDALGDTHSKYKLNINAHSNNYERTFPQHGVIHVTAGTGGANLTQDGTCLWATCAQPSWSAFRAMHLGALKLHFTASGIEGSFICGPAGGGTNDVTCTKGSIVDRFTVASSSAPVPTESAVAAATSNSMTAQAPVASAAASCAQTALNVSSATSEGGFSYRIRKSFGTPADNSSFKTQSTLRIFESGLELGPAHSNHADISNLGQGRFSHWSAVDGTGESFRFSASNNSDPRTNGKSYAFCLSTTSTADTQAPSVPANLNATAVSSSQINLSWTAATDNVGVTGYKIFRNGTQIGTTSATSYSNSGLTASTSYTYTVAAYDAASNTSGNSIAATAKTTATTSGTSTTDDWKIQGFASAAGVTGGAGGKNIVVTNLNSSGAGSLAAAIATSGTRNITFTPGLTGTIKFVNVVYVPNDNMTIDGAGANITISGYSLSVFKGSETPVKNVIIKNLTFANTTADRNAINIEYGSYNIWVDHCTFYSNSVSGIGQGVSVWDRNLGGHTGITLSWNHFKTPNKKSILIGSTVQTKKAARVSVHHNWFEGVDARNPRIHGGLLVHMWNNYVSNWVEVGTAVSGPSDVLVENNIFESKGNSNAIDANYGGTSNSVNASGNLVLGSPLPVIETQGTFPRAAITYTPNLEKADNTLKQRLIQGAGA